MKKILSLILSVLMIFSLAACAGQNAETTDEPKDAALKFGAGSYAVVGASDATADKEGYGQLDVTFAAVTVDAEGKIGSCDLDVLSLTAKFDINGKAIASAEAKSKYEQGDAYSMVAYGGAVQEWYKQADAFEALIAGKTLDEVKALVAEGDKGTDEVINAGCTIVIKEFVLAVEKAYNNAAASNVTAADTVKVTSSASQELLDYVAEKGYGENKYSAYIFASAVNAEGKAVAAISDCVEVTFTFDQAGKSTYDLTKAIQSKREQGTNYGMVNYGGAAKEWFEQVDAFDALCIGKTGEEIKALMGADYKGTADVQAAGCTIYVSGLVAAASKI